MRINLQEKIERIKNWCLKKASIENIEVKDLPYFKERELWWAHVGANIGFEQDGHGKKYLRPVLILKKINKNLFVGIPQTTKTKIDHKQYYKYTYGGRNFVLLLLQVRVFSSKRLDKKMGMLEEKHFNLIRKQFKDWL